MRKIKNNKESRFWRFENAAITNETKEATLYVYGDIVTYDLDMLNWPDDVVPNKFRKELTALRDVSTIHVRINSNGGSIFAAYAIMNLLKSHKAKIITYNDGIAASAATIIAMAGDKIVTALGSVWMVHLPALQIRDTLNANDLQKLTSILTTISESMADIYHVKTGIEKARILQMMNEDTWLTGSQALAKGFADEVTDLEVVAYFDKDKQTAFFNGLNVNLENISNKEALTSLLGEKSNPEAIQNQPVNPVNTNAQKERKENLMNLEDLKAKYLDIYTAAVNEGINQERQRIQAIENMTLPGMEELTDKAKFETGLTPEALAVELIKAQKQKGIGYLNNVKSDTEHLNNVPNLPPAGKEAEEEALLAHLAKQL